MCERERENKREGKRERERERDEIAAFGSSVSKGHKNQQSQKSQEIYKIGDKTNYYYYSQYV